MTVICKIQIGPDRNQYEYKATRDGTRWIGIRGNPYAAAGEKLVLVMMKDESGLGGFVWIAFDTSNADFNSLHEGRAVFKTHDVGALAQGLHTWSYNANAQNPGAPPDWQGNMSFVTKVLEKEGPSGQSQVPRFSIEDGRLEAMMGT